MAASARCIGTPMISIKCVYFGLAGSGVGRVFDLGGGGGEFLEKTTPDFELANLSDTSSCTLSKGADFRPSLDSASLMSLPK